MADRKKKSGAAKGKNGKPEAVKQNKKSMQPKRPTASKHDGNKPKPKKPKKKKAPDWEKIKTEYVTGSLSYQKLADKHSVSVNTLKGRAKREKWGDARAASRRKVQKRKQAKIENKLADEAAEETLDVLGVAYRLLEVISDKIEQYVQPKEIKALSGALKDINDIQIINTTDNKDLNVTVTFGKTIGEESEYAE